MKCFCGKPIPIFGNVLWCDDCIDEWLAGVPEPTMEAFIARKRREASHA